MFSETTRDRLLLALPTVLSVVVGASVLDHWPMWEAELFSLSILQGDLASTVDGAAQDRHPPLYFLLLAALAKVSNAAWVFRLPTALAGAVATWLTTRFALARLGPVGVLAGLWMALTPVFVMYQGVARMYGTLPALSVGLMAAAWTTGRASTRLGAVSLGLLVSASLYTHYIMLLPALAAGGSALWLSLSASEGRRARVGATVVAMVLGGLSFLPWALGPLSDQTRSDVWESLNPAVFEYLLWPVDKRVFASAWIWVGVAALGGWALIKRLPGLVVPWLGVALAGPLALSMSRDVTHRLYVHVGMLPLMALCVAAGLGQILGTRRSTLALGGLLVLALQATPLAELRAMPSLPLGTAQDGAANGVFEPRLEARLLVEAVHGGVLRSGEGGPAVLMYEQAEPRLPVQRTNTDEPYAFTLGSAGGSRLLGLEAGPEGECTFHLGFLRPLHAPAAEHCEALQAALESAPDGETHGPFLLERASTRWNQGRQGEAVDLAREATAQMVDAGLAHLVLAWMLRERGELEDALDQAQRARFLAAVYDDRRVWLEATGLLEPILEDLGRPREAGAMKDVLTCVGSPEALHRAAECGYGRVYWRW